MKKNLLEYIDLFIKGDNSALIKIRSLVLEEIVKDVSKDEYNSFCYEIHDEDSYVVENRSEEDIKDGMRNFNDFRIWFAERKLKYIHFWVEEGLVTNYNIQEVRSKLLEICDRSFEDIVLVQSKKPEKKTLFQKFFSK